MSAEKRASGASSGTIANVSHPTHPHHKPSARTRFSTPQLIRSLFLRFPLQTLSPEPLPSNPHDIALSSQGDATTSATTSPDSLPVLHIFSDPASARRGAPSYNPSCLQHQAWLRIYGVETRCVSSSNHAAPDGALPFLMPARRRSSDKERRTAEHPADSEETKTKAGTVRGASDAISEGLGLGPARARSGADAEDRPISSSKLWAWTSAQSERSAVGPRVAKDSLAAAREVVYITLVDQCLRAAWLHALYLTPANFHLLESLYIQSTTSSTAVHAMQAASLQQAAREALHALSPPTSSAHRVQSSAFRPLTLLPSVTKNSLPSPLISQLFPTREDARRIYAAADGALDALAELLGQDVFFFGADRPGRLDVLLFSYVHLMIGHEKIKHQWKDTTWPDLGHKSDKGREKLRMHWKHVLRECGWV